MKAWIFWSRRWRISVVAAFRSARGIIGEGPCREDLVSLAAKRGVSSQIEFLGRIHPDAARARLLESHVVVLPRRPDEVCNLIPPIKLAEAQAMNLRIIASDVNAMKIELEGNSRARLFPQAALPAWKNA